MISGSIGGCRHRHKTLAKWRNIHPIIDQINADLGGIVAVEGDFSDVQCVHEAVFVDDCAARLHLNACDDAPDFVVIGDVAGRDVDVR